MLSPARPREEWSLPKHRLGRRILVFDRLESTNTYAAQFTDETAHDGLVILADEQTGGRGQHGRSWQCPHGAGILLSVVLFPPLKLRRPALLTAWAAVAICETIGTCSGLQAHIKWPNDVLIQTLKVCGLLIEQGRNTVLGIGLNVNQSADFFAESGLFGAASLASLAGHAFDRRELAIQLINHLDKEYELLRRGESISLETRWRSQTGLVGKHVKVECLDRSLYGLLKDQTWHGLKLELPDATQINLAVETVRHIHPL